MPAELKILLIEDSRTDAELELRELKRAGLRCDARRVDTEADYRRDLAEFRPHIILSDFSMPKFDGMTALTIARETSPEIPFIFVSGTLGEEYAIRALKNGATDYVLKSNLIRLPVAVERALQDARERTARKLAEQTLRASEERARLIIEFAFDAFIAMDGNGTIIEWNKQAELTFGWARDAVVGRNLADTIIPERYREAHRQGIERFLATGHGPVLNKRIEITALHRDGHEFPIELGITPLHTEGGRAFGSFVRDITERKAQESKIARLTRIHVVLSGINSLIVRVRDRQELFDAACRIAVEHGNFGLAWISKFDPATLDVTPVAWAGTDAGDYAAGSKSTARADVPQGQGVVGRAIREKKPAVCNDITAEPDVGSVKRKEAIRRGFRSLVGLPLMVEGAVWGTLTLYAKERDFFNEEELKLLTELAGDISFALEHIGKEEKLNYLAYYDALTGLPNRALFHERLSHQLRLAERNGTKVALLLGDVRRFRYVNESLGRQVGDALLRELAARALKIWPDPDNMARVAGDCFAGFVTDLKDEAWIAHLLDKLVTEALASPFQFEGKELAIAMRAGVAVFPADGRDTETLLRNAEAALKNAKASGERYLFYEPTMNATVAETLLLENKMRRALDRQEFVLHYQPKVDLAKGNISGLEALIRWNDPETGLVPPARFIPLLEETGMILQAGQWAIRRALADHRDWCNQGLRPLRVAVNVSSIQLRQKNFVDAVRRAIDESMAAHHGLDLEITESLIMEDIENNIQKLRALRDMSVNIAIDDFGTGYSSLGYLTKLPVNALKIDRSFIVTMATNPDNLSIVSTIISLAHSLSLKVIAEGVETEEQSKILKLLKCDEIQGYLVSRPVAADQVEGILLK